MINRRTETVALVTVAITSFVTAFGTNATNLSIPAIGSEFGSSALALSRIVSSYVLASAATLTSFGRLADITGRKRINLVGVCAFAATSLACAIAPSVQWLIAARVMQGIGAAMIFSTANAIVSSVFPPQIRGRALGLTTAATYSGLSAGPVLGGFLCQNFGWRSVFVMNVPICGIVAFLMAAYLKGEWMGAPGEKFDAGGSALYITGIAAALYGLSSLSTLAVAKYLFVAGVALLVAFVLYEQRQDHPLVRIDLYSRNLHFSLSNLAAMINYSATSALTFVLSIHLQVVMGLAPQVAGLVMLAQPLTMAVFSPYAGSLSDRVEPRVVASTGMAITAVGLFVLSLLLRQASVWLIVMDLAFIGLGFALFSSPNVNSIMGAVPKRFYGLASSSVATMRVIGQGVSMAIVTLLMMAYVGDVGLASAGRSQLVTAGRWSFGVFAVLCALGVVASMARGRAHAPEPEAIGDAPATSRP